MAPLLHRATIIKHLTKKTLFQVPVAVQSVVVTESLAADALPVTGHRGKSAGADGKPGRCTRRPEGVAAASGFSELSAEPVQCSGDGRQPVKSRRGLGDRYSTPSTATEQDGGTIGQVKAVRCYGNCQQNCCK